MKNMNEMLDEIASQGRYGDTMLAHINPQEAEILKALGGAGTVNPKTGLPEFWGIKVGPIGIGSSYGGVSVGGTSTADLWDTAKGTVKGVVNWAKDHPLEAAALVAAGYYYAPEISAWMTPEGSAIVGTEAGTTAGAATLTAEEVAAQQLAAQQAAAHVTSGVSAEALAAANATADPLGALIAEQGWSVVDPAYLTAIGVTEGMNPAIAAGVNKGLTFSQAVDLAKAGLLVNAITGDPLGLGGGQPQQSAPAGFAQVEIPAEWKSPTYAAPSAPIDLESIFSNQNMLGGTQWQNLPNQQPNVSFNDIFAAGQQQTPMGMPVDINQIVSSILGQAATSQKPA